MAAAPQAQADARFRLIGVVAPRAAAAKRRRAGADRHRRQAAQGLSRGRARSMANWCCRRCIRAARRSGRAASRRRWRSSCRRCRRRPPARCRVPALASPVPRAAIGLPPRPPPQPPQPVPMPPPRPPDADEPEPQPEPANRPMLVAAHRRWPSARLTVAGHLTRARAAGQRTAMSASESIPAASLVSQPVRRAAALRALCADGGGRCRGLRAAGAADLLRARRSAAAAGRRAGVASAVPAPRQRGRRAAGRGCGRQPLRARGRRAVPGGGLAGAPAR